MKFLKQIQQDFKLLVYMQALIMLFRVVFILVFWGQLPNATELPSALWYGFRISLKTTGILTAVTFLFATIPACFFQNYPATTIRKYWGMFCTILFTFLFMARIPYYKIYTQGFNEMLINGLKDDQAAIIKTTLEQYQLLPRLAGVLALSLFFCYVWKKLLALPPITVPHKLAKPCTFLFIALLPAIFLCLRFGGGYSYATGIHWESAARTKSNLLNEAILDDGQSLYRVWNIYEKIHSAQTEKIPNTKVREGLKVLTNKSIVGGNIDSALKRKSKGANLPLKPQQVIFILGENYALWPLLPKYQNLELCPTGEKMANEGAYTYHFLANGSGTMTSLNGLISGLVDVGLYPNYMTSAKNNNYPTGIGTVLKAANYHTVFWYGGQSSWQNIKRYALNQGFAEFYSADSFPQYNSITWGISDAELFAQVEKYIAEHQKPTFHFILTTSNHPPYSLDVDKEGFPREQVASKLPSTINNTKDDLTQLGHVWYADMEIGKFLTRVQSIDKTAFFVLTGDHAERFNFAQEVSLEELSGVPCFFYGAGVTKNLLPPSMVGSHVQLIPTLAELLLPQGTEYYSLLLPLQESKEAFNHKLAISNNKLQKQNLLQDAHLKAIIQAARTVSIKRIVDGNASLNN